MDAINSKKIPQEIFLNSEKLSAYLLGADANFAIEESGEYIMVHGSYEDLEQLCRQTNARSFNVKFSFQDEPSINIPGMMTYVVARKGMTLERIIAAIKNV
ncbi:MAG: hypothetical protein UR69_C0004G0066 [Candidatus Moranbacteria bacterium GW2011_GWE2_35_2-]|nr:MAG: hypothetical protein UR69_C0004G0066 [Candidatus Moranbacteria bacterium GW2011_GWE2_35_2-]KKQ05600.1 MAG: hypothetical protein US15_C0027G0004 [Candidatus Moranbacteria bacterium GW2011_GWF1_36_4]KKQ22240.1 MAG: hypothetical protein US37_C0003G0066 [Candidatus Moranbacteria bacterium GW2011_GWF2_37_11]KKQ28603.1 MAG: hypothetical protein US44_C0009G0030 [Candidatus Moranbacteria bacterium GW2011_GWD1_37_17]KKQ30268.1 MAG: hypothetical protein US47_C0003G0063 [Candidatus Moranbacteria b